MILSTLEAIEATNSTKEKTALFAGAHSNAMSLFLHAVYAYDRLYYIKDLPEVAGAGESKDIEEGQWLAPFLELLDECKKTGRTQETKQKVIGWLESQNPLVAKWCRRAILRDLRIGVGVELVNKAGYNIPVFEVQLATDGKKCKKLSSMFPGYVSPKLDGYRCFAVYKDGEVRLLSRNGSVFKNFPTIEAAVVELAKRMEQAALVLDGEIMSDDFNSMQKSAFASVRGTTVGDVKFHIFDRLSYLEYEEGEFAEMFVDRVPYIEALGKYTENLPLVIVPHVEVNSEEEILNLERKYLEDGYEGAMFRSAELVYYFGKKSNKMLKFKTMQSQDCVITGMIEGEGKYVGMLGALVVRQENGVSCEVGTGFTDQMRKEFWDNKDDIIDKMIEVKYQELSPDSVMRFPVYMRFRDDKAKEA